MATMILIKQLAGWLEGKLSQTRVKRNPKPLDLSVQPTITVTPQRHTGNSRSWLINLDRFHSYKEKIMPKLQEADYQYFLACRSDDYRIHEEWCHEHCERPSLPFCDVWQLDCLYPRAFISDFDRCIICLEFRYNQNRHQ